MAMSPKLLRPKATGTSVPQFSERGYSRLWCLTTKSSGNVSGSASSDTGHYAVKWWDNTTTVYDSGDPFSKAAAGNQRAFEVYPVNPAGTSLLLNFNGSNGSTTFTDSSPNGLTVTAAGGAQISTAQSKFGGASGYFDGDGDYLELDGDAESLTFGEGDFTVELWFRSPASQAEEYATVFGGASAGAFLLSIISESGSPAKVGFNRYGQNGPDFAASITADTWHHLAACRNAGTMRLFLDGSQVGSDTDAVDFYAPSNRVASTVSAAQYYEGYIDDLRIVKGQALYTANFTPPTAALTATATTYDPSGQFDGFDVSDNALTQVRAEDVSLEDAGAGGWGPGSVLTWYGYNYYSTYVSGSPAETGDISGNNLSSVALDQFYTDLDAGGGDLFVSGNPGIDADDPTIATAKGYTVFGSVPP